ncbi:MAG: hypothetical protein GY898_00800 [Proteobacteria bacterium]|nr:hypothetical protein [Pseudomonadota bacterium]
MPAGAFAHGGTLFGTTPMVEDGAFVGGGTSWGLILLDEDGVPRWTCEEALGIDLEPTFWARRGDGRVLAGTPFGMRWSDDGGCTWDPVPGPLEDVFVTAAATHRAVPDRIVAVGGTVGVDQVIWTTDDGGETWVEAADPGLDTLALGRIAMSADGLRIRGVALRSATTEYVIIGSDDGGASWLAPHELEGWDSPILSLFRDDGEVLYLSAFDVGGTPFFIGLDADFTSNAQTLALLDSPARTAAQFDESIYLVTDNAGLHILEPGQQIEPLIVGGPSACLALAGDVLLGCGHDPVLPQFSTTDDGLAWEALVSFDDVQERACPADSVAAEVCPIVWDALHAVIDPGDDDDSAEGDDDDDTDWFGDDDDDGCEGCSAGQGRGAGRGLVVLGLMWRRRRGSSRPELHHHRAVRVGPDHQPLAGTVLLHRRRGALD